MRDGWTASNSSDLKVLNRLLVRETIHTCGPIARYQIARKTGLTPTTVTVIVNDLMNEGVVREIGLGKSTGGRRPVLLELNPSCAYVFAVRVQRGEIITALIDVTGRCIAKHVLRSGSSLPDDVIDVVGRSFEALLEEAGVERRRALWCGVASPGLVNPKAGVVERSTNMAWEKVALGDMLSQRLGGVSVHVENISNAAALAETKYGSARGCTELLYVNLSVGIGAGIISGGMIYGGARGYAGELGHIALTPYGGPECFCGKTGCLEAYCGLRTVMGRIRNVMSPDLLKKHELSAEAMTLEDIVSHSLDQTSEIRDVLDDVAHMVGTALCNLLCLFNPEVIVIGGELAKLGDWFISAIARTAHARAIREMSSMVQIVPSTMQQDPPLMGAYTLALGHLLSMDPW